MPQATRKNQERIIANQKKIMRNQLRLIMILEAQGVIRRNLQAILKNEKKIVAALSKLLADGRRSAS